MESPNVYVIFDKWIEVHQIKWQDYSLTHALAIVAQMQSKAQWEKT